MSCSMLQHKVGPGTKWSYIYVLHVQSQPPSTVNTASFPHLPPTLDGISTLYPSTMTLALVSESGVALLQ